MSRALMTALLILSALSAACGKADIGGSCDTSGATDECVDGAVCTKNASGSGNTCRKTCTDQTQCATGEACNGVSGSSLKSCQPA